MPKLFTRRRMIGAGGAAVALSPLALAKTASAATDPSGPVTVLVTPQRLYDSRTDMTPLGGAKGSGLSLMIEILASVLAGNPVIAPALTGNGAGRMNGLAMSVQIDAFGGTDRFTSDVAQLAQALKVVPLAAGTSAILMPGERGFAEAASRRTNGIPIASGTVARLAKLAERFGVGPPPIAEETRR